MVLAPSLKREPSTEIQRMKESLSEEIIAAMSGLSLEKLKNIHSASEWSYIEFEEEHILLPQQSVYMSIISKSFFNILEMITADDSLDKETTSLWINKMTEKIVKTYISEIVQIPLLSGEGQLQLKVDIQYMITTLSSIGLNYGDQLPAILEILNIPKKDKNIRIKRLQKEDIQENVRNALQKSLSLT